MTLSLILCVVAIVLWVLASIQSRLNFNSPVHLGWLGLAFWGVSLLVR